jgi:diguanylate cyclase (GGDEF)-like protein/PAS domain S-box-containing protein
LSLVLIVAMAGLALVLAMTLGVAAMQARRHRARLAAATERAAFLGMVVDHASEGLTVLDGRGRLIWANPAYARLMGRPLEQMIGQNPLSYALPEDKKPSDDFIRNFRFDRSIYRTGLVEVVENVRGDGSHFWIQISVASRGERDDDPVILVCRDISEQIDREQRLLETSNQLERAASTDALTGLANRAALLATAARALQMPGPGTGPAAPRLGLLHIDLDRFKEINDTHGHAAGDAVLVHVADALRRSIRPGDLAARLGGDEFVVLCQGLDSLDELSVCGDRIAAAVAEPLFWRDRVLAVSASIGADLADPDSQTLESLLQRSDFALYEAKRAGRARLAAYDEAVHDRYVANQALADDLASAVRNRQIGFAFQPVLDLASGAICTLETLVRWVHPTLGPLSPGTFLPMADDLGLLADLDFLAMDAAMALKAELNKAGHLGLTVAINASGALLNHPCFLTRLDAGMAQYGLLPREIGVEVLETVVFEAPGSDDLATEVISALRARGHPVMLDDFGVGYAGLAHLAKLEVSGIKIDLSLVQAAKTDPTSVLILEALIELCAKLRITSVAEGVDTIWMATRLQDMGCSRLQGWWLAPALPAHEVIVWLGGQSVSEAPASSPALAQGPDPNAAAALPAPIAAGRAAR